MIETTEHGRVVHLALAAPPVNVLDMALLDDLATHLEQLGRRDDLAAVLLSGSGRCFSAGASVTEHREDKVDGMLAALDRACAALQGLPVPAVALVHGPCLGGALELISFCDFIVADPQATFGQPEIRLAFFPPVGCVQLPRITGSQNAAWLVLAGETVNAERALSMGLVQKLLPRDSWGEVEDLFNGLSVAALRLAKRSLGVGSTVDVRPPLERAKRLFLDELYRTEDVEEGISSFEQKRKPEWRHR